MTRQIGLCRAFEEAAARTPSSHGAAVLGRFERKKRFDFRTR